jgi:uncharacterized protein (TIGR03083 family)
MSSGEVQRDLEPRSPNFLAHLAQDSARFAEVLRQTPSREQVPTCPDWDAGDLLWHLAEVQWFWGTIVGRGLTTDAQVEALVREKRPVGRDQLLAHFDRASNDLQQNLRAAPPDMPAWTWSQDQTVGFIRRRQAHEALIHRIDAELTNGDRTPMDAELSTDGVDEALHYNDVKVPSWGLLTRDPTQTVRVRAVDTDRSWLLTLARLTGVDDDGTAHDEPVLAEVAAEARSSSSEEPAAATVTGAAADLDCWLWHRPTVGGIDRAGDPLVLDRLHEIFAGEMA